MPSFIKISIEELESLLNQQKNLVVEQLLGQKSYYRKEESASSNINEELFKKCANMSKKPNDFIVLKKYIE